MSSTAEPVHLNNHHRATVRQIFEHPVSHNIEWHAVISLLEAIGSVTKHHNGKLGVAVGGQTAVFDPRAQKDVDEQAVIDLRHMLAAAGYDPEATAHEA